MQALQSTQSKAHLLASTRQPLRCSSRLLPACPQCHHVPRSAWLLHHTRQPIACASQSGGGGLNDDVDVAVFRFTLGIPGFEDRLIPRVVGGVGLLLLGVNHILGAQPPPDAQARAEVLIVVLSLLCVLVPEIEIRLREALPGRGRQSMAENIAGASNGFALAPALPEQVKKELAWSSASLIKNTNTCGVVVVSGGKVVMARGALAAGAYKPGAAQQTLDSLTQGLSALTSQPETSSLITATSASASSSATPTTQQQQAYYPDRQAMSAVQLAASSSVPSGVQSVLVQALPGAPQPSYMLVYSERPRAMSEKERRWVAAVADKLSPFLQK